MPDLEQKIVIEHKNEDAQIHYGIAGAFSVLSIGGGSLLYSFLRSMESASEENSLWVSLVCGGLGLVSAGKLVLNAYFNSNTKTVIDKGNGTITYEYFGKYESKLVEYDVIKDVEVIQSKLHHNLDLGYLVLTVKPKDKSELKTILTPPLKNPYALKRRIQE